MVPQLVICHKCAAILYESIELKPTEEIIVDYDGRCPTCGKKLSYMPIDVEVKPVEETNQLRPLEPEEKRPSRKKSRKKPRNVKEKGMRSYETKSGSIWKKESV